MAKALGTRLIAGLFIGASFIPPWIQAVVTLPIGLALYKQAKNKEQEREQELDAIKEATS